MRQRRRRSTYRDLQTQAWGLEAQLGNTAAAQQIVDRTRRR